MSQARVIRAYADTSVFGGESVAGLGPIAIHSPNEVVFEETRDEGI